MPNIRFIDSGTPVGAYGIPKVDNATSSSFATSASFASNAITASHALFAVSASFEITKEVSSSHANTADVADGLQGQPSISVTSITASGNISSSSTITSNFLNVGTRVKAIGSSLEFAGDELSFVDGNSVSQLFKGTSAGAFEAYYAGVKRFETTATGVNITSNITASGNVSSSAISTASFGTYLGDGSGLFNIPASGIVGLNLSQIASGSVTASIAPDKGFQVNTDTQITGSLSLSGSQDIKDGNLTISGSSNYSIIITGSSTQNATNGSEIAIVDTTRHTTSSNGYGPKITLKAAPNDSTYGTTTTINAISTTSGGADSPPRTVINSNRPLFYNNTTTDYSGFALRIRNNTSPSNRNVEHRFHLSGQSGGYAHIARSQMGTGRLFLHGLGSSGIYGMMLKASQDDYLIIGPQTSGTDGDEVVRITSTAFKVTGNTEITGDITSITEITASGNVSSSAASTASFGTYLGDGSQLTGIVTATDLSSSIFVSPSGNDTTGTVGDLMKPFATLYTASLSATTGSTIFVYPGTYTVSNNLAREGVNYYFYPGTTISSSYAGAIFDVEGFRTSPYGFNVYGNADFHFHTSNAASLWEAGALNVEVTFNWTLEFQDVTTTSDATDTIIRLGGTGQTSRIKFRDATIQGTLIQNDASYTDSQRIKIEGNMFNSTNGGFFTQGGNAGPAYMQVDMAYVYAGGSAHAFANLGYNVGLLFNIAYCYGPSGAYQFNASGGESQNAVINGYANEINMTNVDLTHNGDCDDLVMTGGRYVGNSVKKATLSGGESRFTPNYQTSQGNSISVSGGVHTIELAERNTNYFHNITVSDGKCILVGHDQGFYNNGNIRVSGGELIYKAHVEFANAHNSGYRQPINLSGGVLRMKGYIKNNLTDSDGAAREAACIKKTGGTLILDGATLIVSSSIAPPIWAPDQSEEVKIFSGGVNTNRTGSLGLLAASSSFGSGGYALTNPLGGMIIEDASVE